MFDLTSDKVKDHFLNLIILQYISTNGLKNKTHGFVKYSELENFLHSLGFLSKQYNIALSNLCKSKLIESDPKVLTIVESIENNRINSLRITTIGAYHLKKLPYMFVYYDAISTDIPILSREFREKILDVEDITDRLERCRILLDYLDKCANEDLPQESYIEWKKMVSDTHKNIDYIKYKLQINR